MAETILVATDGSPCAVAAEDFAIALAAEHGWRVCGLFAVDPRYLGGAVITDLAAAVGATFPGNFRNRVSHLLEARGGAVLERLAAACAAAGVPFESRVVKGHPGEAVCEAAAGARIIVLGRLGDEGVWARRLLGSTVEIVSRHAPVPVLVVPGPSLDAKSILVAYGGGPQSGLALTWAARMARPRHRPVIVLTVQPNVEEAQRIAGVGCALLEGEGISARAASARGDPAAAILAEVHSSSPGLVVVGSSRHTAFRSFILGGTTARVMHDCPVPVLICR